MNDSLKIEIELLGAQIVMGEINRLASNLGRLGAGALSQGLAELGIEASVAVPALGAAAAAFALVAVAATRAATDLAAFAQTQAGLASTTAETAQLRLMGRAFGFDPVSAAAGARQRAFSDPLAAGAASRLGFPLNQPFDISNRMDLGKAFSDAMDHAAREFRGSPAQASADVANLLGPQFVALLPVWARANAEAKSAAEEIQKAYSPEMLARGQMLNLHLAVLQAHFGELATVVGEQLIPLIDLMAQGLTNLATHVGEIARAMLFNMTNGLSEAFFIAKDMGNANGGSQKAATDANTEALRENTASVRDLKYGMFGGGPAQRGSIPRAFQGFGAQDLRDAYKGNAARLGAYSVSM